MDIQQAMEHAREVTKRKRAEATNNFPTLVEYYNECKKCADEHEQLAQWLEELEQYKALGALEEVREAADTVRRYETQYLDDMENPLEPLKISSALKSEIMKLEFRKQRNPESISIFDYTIIAALQKVLKEVGGES